MWLFCCIAETPRSMTFIENKLENVLAKVLHNLLSSIPKQEKRGLKNVIQCVCLRGCIALKSLKRKRIHNHSCKEGGKCMMAPLLILIQRALNLL